MATLEPYFDVIKRLVEVDGLTHLQVSCHLKEKFGDVRGFSERNIRKFCSENTIRKWGPLIAESDLKTAVDDAVEQVGPSFGRKMMTGYLSSQGIKASEVRVGRVLRDTHQPYHEARQRGARNINPIPYFAEYFGHKLHMDQNEKLAMFGVTHVLAIDGYSSKIISFKSMPIKNNLKIYDTVYRAAVLEYGMWDQIRVDHGTEFYLTLYMQERNSHLRHNQNRQPYIQTQSKRNHKVERMWPEVNQRVSYPIKTALVHLVNSDQLDMDDNLVKYCLSNICVQLAEIGINRFVNSWNSHRIPGHGIPNNMAQQLTPAPVAVDAFPPSDVAAAMYAEDMGSTLTAESLFGEDPFRSDEARQQCQDEFRRVVPDLHHLLNRALNEDYLPLQYAVHKLVEMTKWHTS